MIWSNNFLGWYIHHNRIEEYKRSLFDKICFTIENLKINYESIMIMPVKRLEDLIKWKISLESEKTKLISDNKNG